MYCMHSHAYLLAESLLAVHMQPVRSLGANLTGSDAIYMQDWQRQQQYIKHLKSEVTRLQQLLQVEHAC